MKERELLEKFRKLWQMIDRLKAKIIDEDDLASDSDAHVPTQQSVKAYADSIKLDDLTAPDDNTDLDASTSAHGLLKKLPNDATQVLGGTGAWGNADLQPYQVADGTGDQTIDGTEATLNLDTELISNGNYSLSGDHITITDAGTYHISYTMMWDTTNNAGDSGHLVETHCEKITAGPTYTNIPASYDRNYAVESGTGNAAGACGAGFLAEFSAGDGVRVRMDRVLGTTNIDTTQNKSQLSIMKVSD